MIIQKKRGDHYGKGGERERVMAGTQNENQEKVA